MAYEFREIDFDQVEGRVARSAVMWSGAEADDYDRDAAGAQAVRRVAERITRQALKALSAAGRPVQDP